MIPAPTTRRAVAAEWIKIRTVRATWLSALVAVAAALFIGLLDYQNAADGWASWDPVHRARFDPVRYGFSGAFYLAVLALGALGTMAAAGEYGTGLIRTTFTANPRRGQVVAAKALVVGGVTLVLGETLAFGTFLLGQNALRAKQLSVALSDPGVARAVVGCGLFLAAMALIGLGLGFVIRRPAGALATLFGLFFVAPMLLGAAGDTAGRFGLQSVFEGLSSTAAHPDDNWPSAGLGFGILAGYVLLALGAAVLAVRRRDA